MTAYTAAFLLALGAPLIASVCIALLLLTDLPAASAERYTARMAQTAAITSLITAIAAALIAFWQPSTHSIPLGTWLENGEFTIGISVYIDGLSLTLALLITFLLALTVRFSVLYMHREAGFQRFFLGLMLFEFAMLLLVVGGNLVMTFIGWELAGVSSYLLISYAWQRPIATENATRAFVTNRIGDAAFLLAIFAALTHWGSSEWPLLLNSAYHDANYLALGIVALGLSVAALVKSAQFPFSAWITRALEGPTPSSAIFYGSVMVHAGLYLLLRLEPWLEQMPLLRSLLFLIGALTFIYAWVNAQIQTDIKSSLLFATLLQTSLMLMSIALGWYTLALIHLCLHALWRLYHFLISPSFLQFFQEPAPPAPAWFRRARWLHIAALQRFWLDPISDWFLVRPTQMLAREAQTFDEQVVDRITGTPSKANQLATLAQMQALQSGQLSLDKEVGIGSGLFGLALQRLAEGFEWFEEKLLLKTSSQGLARLAKVLGERADLIESYLRQPRYLLVLIAATMVVIL